MPAKKFCDPEKEIYWRSVLQRFESSGLSGMEFCRREAIKYTHFSDWRQRIRKRDRAGIQLTERTDSEWTEIIEAARSNPIGVRDYLERHGIDKKAYYKRFRRLRHGHPEWKTLSGRGRRPKAKSRSSGNSNTKAQGFARVELIDSSKSKTTSSIASVVEVVLPNSLVVRVDTNCSLEFLSSLVTALGAR